MKLVVVVTLVVVIIVIVVIIIIVVIVVIIVIVVVVVVVPPTVDFLGLRKRIHPYCCCCCCCINTAALKPNQRFAKKKLSCRRLHAALMSQPSRMLMLLFVICLWFEVRCIDGSLRVSFSK